MVAQTLYAETAESVARRESAAQARKLAAEPASPFPSGIYKAFHEKLKDWRTRNNNQIEKP